jgi:hypothetical protein
MPILSTRHEDEQANPHGRNGRPMISSGLIAASCPDIVFHTPILATVGPLRSVCSPPSLRSFRQGFTCLGMPQNVEEFQTRTAGKSSHSMVPSTAI